MVPSIAWKPRVRSTCRSSQTRSCCALAAFFATAMAFSSGWTFASTGVTGNGTSAYMDTGVQPSTQLTSNSTHISYYSRTNNASTLYSDCGVQDDITPSIGRNLYIGFGSTTVFPSLSVNFV